jgi:hypothetical protein
LCDRYVEVTAHRIELLRIDPAVDHPITVRADATKGAGGLADRDAIGHIPGWHLGRAARQAEDAAGAARLLCTRSAGNQETSKLNTSKDGRPLAVDRRQALPDPVVEAPRDDEIRVGFISLSRRGKNRRMKEAAGIEFTGELQGEVKLLTQIA